MTDHVIVLYLEKNGVCPEYLVHFSMQMKENKKNNVPQNVVLLLYHHVTQKTVHDKCGIC